jgi:hypothetical protein
MWESSRVPDWRGEGAAGELKEGWGGNSFSDGNKAQAQ